MIDPRSGVEVPDDVPMDELLNALRRDREWAILAYELTDQQVRRLDEVYGLDSSPPEE